MQNSAAVTKLYGVTFACLPVYVVWKLYLNTKYKTKQMKTKNSVDWISECMLVGNVIYQMIPESYLWTTVPPKSELPPLVSFLARQVSFLLRRFSFLSRITEVYSMAYITRKKLLSVTIVALQFTGKSMGTSNRWYIYALIVRLIHMEQTLNVCSDNCLLGTEFASSENTIVLINLRRKRNSS